VRQHPNRDASSLDMAAAEPWCFSNVLAKIRKVPDRFRTFSVPADRAAKEYQVTRELQDALLRAGMPSRLSGGTIFFDRADLLNISLHLDIGSFHRKILAWWVRELERPSGETALYRMDYVAGCPEPDHARQCTYGIVVPDSPLVEVASNDRESRIRHSITFTVRRKFPRLRPSMMALIDSLQDISFMRLPRTLKHDVDFIQREKVGDCAGMAAMLTSRAASQGITARRSVGRALTPPFSSSHSWTEFLVDDIWVPVDPVFIDAMLEWEILDKDKWSRYSSIGGILGRIGSAPGPLVFHNGRPVPAQYPASRISLDAP
jgi:hypothetical protein